MLLATAALGQAKPTLLHTPPAAATAGEPLRIEGSLLGASKIERVVIRFRGPGEPWAEAVMELQYGDLFRGYIPRERVSAPGVEYFIEGIGFDRKRQALFGSAQKPLRLTVAGTGKVVEEKKPAEPERSPPKEREPDPMLANDEPEPRHRDQRPAEKAKDGRAGAIDEAFTEGKEGRASAIDDAFGDEPPPTGRRQTPRDEKTATAKAEPRQPEKEKTASRERTELEEELLVFGAEDTVALATRHEETVTRVPAIASSYSRAQIRALGARNVYELLDFVPGLSVSRDVQGFHRVAIRGIRNDPEILFLLNGHRLNNFYDGRALGNLPIENLERIEVVRGPGSAVYGSGAFAGVVNIITRSEEGLNFAASGGHYEAFTGHVAAGKAFGNVTLHLDADVLSQYGYRKPIEKDNLERQTAAQGLREEGAPAGLTNDRRFLVNVGGGARYQRDSLGELDLSVRFLTEDRGALVGLFDVVGPESSLAWTVLLADLTFERPFSEALSLKLHGYFDTQSVDRLFQLSPRDFRPTSSSPVSELGLRERTQLTTQTFGADAAVEAALSATNRLTVGLSVDQQSLPSYSYLANYTVPDSSPLADFAEPGPVNPLTNGRIAATRRLSLAVYAQDQWRPVEPLSLILGLRVDAVSLPEVDAQGEVLVSGDGSLQGTTLVPSFNPRAGVVFTASDALVLKALYQRAFRSPTVQELTESIPESSLNQGRFTGNPSLRPATVDAVEVGADYLQAAGDARVRLRVNAFWENFLGAIARVDTTGNIVPLRNRTGVRTLGVEGEARLESTRRASAFVNAGWFRAVDLETAEQAQLLTESPQARFNTGGTLPVGDLLNLDVNLRFGVERRNNSRSVLELIRRYRIPAYSVVNVQLRTEPLWDRIELAVLAQNVFQQELFDDPPRPDRLALIPRQGFEAFAILRGKL